MPKARSNSIAMYKGFVLFFQPVDAGWAVSAINGAGELIYENRGKLAQSTRAQLARRIDAKLNRNGKIVQKQIISEPTEAQRNFLRLYGWTGKKVA
jgi:hypothetical protein